MSESVTDPVEETVERLSPERTLVEVRWLQARLAGLALADADAEVNLKAERVLGIIAAYLATLEEVGRLGKTLKAKEAEVEALERRLSESVDWGEPRMLRLLEAVYESVRADAPPVEERRAFLNEIVCAAYSLCAEKDIPVPSLEGVSMDLAQSRHEAAEAKAEVEGLKARVTETHVWVSDLADIAEAYKSMGPAAEGRDVVIDNARNYLRERESSPAPTVQEGK